MKIHSSLVKLLFVLGCLLLIGWGLYQQKIANPANLSEDTFQAVSGTDARPIIAYQETIYDFGVCTTGAQITHGYVFTNIGSSPLMIHEAVPSCGLCTTVSFPKEPIQPGERHTIKVTFDSKGRTGKQGKYVIIRANTEPNETRLLLSGTVQPAS